MKSFDITILVTTRKRHELLTNCLQSIEKQSRVDLISKVIVSENSSDTASEEVARKFSGTLPIHYFRQDPEVPVEQHFLKLIERVESPCTAIIADDDMWGRYHLEEAARAFKAHAEIHTFFGQVVVVCNETCYPLRRFAGSMLQVPDSINRDIQDFRILTAREIAMHCMAHTPLNIFSLVSLTETLRHALRESMDAPQPSTDKMLIWKLACLGPIAVGRELSLFYRSHEQSMIKEMLDEDSLQCYASDFLLTREIERQARELGFDPVEDWRQAFTRAQQIGIAEHIHTWSPQHYQYLIRGKALLDHSQPANTSSKQRMRQKTISLLMRLRHALSFWENN